MDGWALSKKYRSKRAFAFQKIERGRVEDSTLYHSQAKFKKAQKEVKMRCVKDEEKDVCVDELWMSWNSRKITRPGGEGKMTERVA